MIEFKYFFYSIFVVGFYVGWQIKAFWINNLRKKKVKAVDFQYENIVGLEEKVTVLLWQWEIENWG